MELSLTHSSVSDELRCPFAMPSASKWLCLGDVQVSLCFDLLLDNDKSRSLDKERSIRCRVSDGYPAKSSDASALHVVIGDSVRGNDFVPCSRMSRSSDRRDSGLSSGLTYRLLILGEDDAAAEPRSAGSDWKERPSILCSLVIVEVGWDNGRCLAIGT